MFEILKLGKKMYRKLFEVPGQRKCLIMGFRPSIPLHYLGCVHCPNEDHSFSDQNVGIFLSIYTYNKVTPKGGCCQINLFTNTPLGHRDL